MPNDRSDEANVNEAEDSRQADAEEIAEMLSSLSPGGILRGMRDTAAHMLSEARAETSLAKDEAWDRYGELTKNRRAPKDDED
jgi:hypothetical protein